MRSFNPRKYHVLPKAGAAPKPKAMKFPMRKVLRTLRLLNNKVN